MSGLRFLAGAAAAALAATPAAGAEDYRVRFEGAPNGLDQKLQIVSTLAARKRDYPTAAALRRAARADVEPLTRAMQAAGYYRASVRFDLDRDEGARRRMVVFIIEPGPKFEITDYRIAYDDAQEAERPLTLADAGVAGDRSAEGAAIQAVHQRFLTALWDRGFPAARMTTRRADADLEAGVATAFLAFETGPHARFGEIRIEGAERTRAGFIRSLKTWKEGETFERSELVVYRDRLAETGVFSSIDVAPGAPEEDGSAPVLVTLEERKRRTIGAGLSYSTAEGPGGRLFFEYRNLFGQGERLNIEMEGSEVQQSLKSTFLKPLPLFPGSAFGQFGFVNETTDAYDARTVEIAGGLARKWLSDRLETRAGLALETSSIETSPLRAGPADSRTYFVSAPLSATWNTENDILNPERGIKASLVFTPYTGSDSFTLTEANIRSRIGFGEDDRFSIAGRARLGGTIGSSLVNLPANKRYYSGGGASVRGYDYQAVGELDADGAPIGGRSVIEAAVEARAKIATRFQLAAFLDAGSVSSAPLPDFGGRFFMGAGGGLRYLTPVGPIRVDVAVPLDKRPTDRGFQLYISLGQSF